MANTPDILPNATGPALASTSDFPVITGTPAPGEPAASQTAEGEPNATTDNSTSTNAAAEAPAAEDTAGEAAEAAEAAEGEETEKVADADGTKEPAADGIKPKPTPGQAIKGRMGTLAEARRIAEEEARAANARADRMERMVEEVLARIPKPETVSQVDPVLAAPAQPRPTREAFETPDAYDDAVIAWAKTEERRETATRQAEEARIAEENRVAVARAAEQRATQARIESIQAAHAARVSAAIEKWPDYEQATTRADLKISLPMAEAILQSENGPDAAYHLSQNPEEAERISAMVMPGQFFPPTLPDGNPHPFAGQAVPDAGRQMVEMGKLFASITAPPESFLQRPRPAAPTPITPLRRANAVAVEPTLEEVGNDVSDGAMEKYAQMRMAALRAENRRH